MVGAADTAAPMSILHRPPYVSSIDLLHRQSFSDGNGRRFRARIRYERISLRRPSFVGLGCTRSIRFSNHGPYATQNDFSTLWRHPSCGNGRRSRARRLRRIAERPQARTDSRKPVLAGWGIPQSLSLETPSHGEVVRKEHGRLSFPLERWAKALARRPARGDKTCGRGRERTHLARPLRVLPEGRRRFDPDRPRPHLRRPRAGRRETLCRSGRVFALLPPRGRPSPHHARPLRPPRSARHQRVEGSRRARRDGLGRRSAFRALGMARRPRHGIGVVGVRAAAPGRRPYVHAVASLLGPQPQAESNTLGRFHARR